MTQQTFVVPSFNSRLRAPRGAVKVNGEEFPIPAWIDWEVESNTFYEPDTFRVSFSVSGMPSGRGLSWWLTQADVEIEIFAGFPSNPDQFSISELKSIFFGRVDSVEFDMEAQIINVTGRDFTSDFLDTKSSEKYTNQTSSDVAKKLATKYGLTPVVTATTTKIGKYVDRDHIDIQSDKTEWDLLTWLAQQEGFLVYVVKKELHFEPRPESSAEPFMVYWQAATSGGSPRASRQNVRLYRELTLAKDIRVIIKTWDQKTGKTRTVTATRQKKGKVQGGNRVQQYTFNRPGLTQQRAEKEADSIARDLSRHEVRLSFDGPADNDLSMTTIIKVDGIGEVADQSFMPDRITRNMTQNGGYYWGVEAKNHLPESTVSP